MAQEWPKNFVQLFLTDKAAPKSKNFPPETAFFAPKTMLLGLFLI